MFEWKHVHVGPKAPLAMKSNFCRWQLASLSSSRHWHIRLSGLYLRWEWHPVSGTSLLLLLSNKPWPRFSTLCTTLHSDLLLRFYGDVRPLRACVEAFAELNSSQEENTQRARRVRGNFPSSVRTPAAGAIKLSPCSGLSLQNCRWDSQTMTMTELWNDSST